MRISKIQIKSLFGIKEKELDGTSVELTGKNGAGKSSIIDAIRLALTNSSNRDYKVHKGETEGEIIIETDTGLKIDRKIRTNKADYKSIKQSGTEVASPETFLKDIFTSLQLNPVYNVEYWENASTGELYTQIERIRKENQTIEKAKMLQEGRESKIRKYDADRQIALSALDTEFSNKESYIEKEVIKLQAQIKELETEKSNLGSKKQDKKDVIENQYKANVAKFDAEVAEYAEYLDKEPQDTTELQKDAENMEKMKGLINEYRRMQRTQGEIDDLRVESDILTNKIEKARTLPGEILQTATIPIDGLTVVDGIPLIHDLPVSNLSDGEKLDLCVDVAIQKPNGLQIILIDGVEKLSTELKNRLYEKCKAKGLQIIATRTTDDDELTVIEL